jgi:hypothetical protein
MIKRPLNKQFNEAVLAGTKTTTIRDTAWPLNCSIMLYNWTAKPYASPQIDVCAITVTEVYCIKISNAGRMMIYNCPIPDLYRTEGFASKEAMDNWFQPLIQKGKSAEKYIMKFQTITSDYGLGLFS